MLLIWIVDQVDIIFLIVNGVIHILVYYLILLLVTYIILIKDIVLYIITTMLILSSHKAFYIWLQCWCISLYQHIISVTMFYFDSRNGFCYNLFFKRV